MIGFLVAQRRWTAGAALLFICVAVVTSTARPLDGSLRGFEMPGNPHLAALDTMARHFGSAPTLQIRIVPRAVALQSLLAALQELDHRLSTVAPGSQTISLHAFATLFPFTGLEHDTDVATALQTLADQPLVRSLISSDRRSFLLVTRTAPDERLNASALDTVVRDSLAAIAALDIFSVPHLELAVRAGIRRDIVILPALILALALLVLLWLYGSVRALAFMGALTAAAVAGAWWTLTVLGFELNVATMLVIPAVIVLSLSDAIHLVTGFSLHGYSGDAESRLRATLERYFVPAVLTSVTTAAAFFSLMTSDTANLRALGLAGGVSVLLALLLTYALGPYLLVALRVRARPSSAVQAALGRVQQYAAPVGMALLALIPIGILLVPRLVFSTPPAHFFPRRAAVTRAHDALSRDFASLSALYLLIEHTNAGDPIMDTATAISRQLEQLDRVALVASVRDFADQAQLAGVPLSELLGAVRENPFVSVDGNRQRMMLRAESNASLTQLERDVHAVLQRYDRGLRWAVSSPLLALEYANTRVASGLLRSFGISMLIVSVVLAALTRSVRSGIIALVANAVPIAAAVALFSMLRLEISVLSATVLVLCLGIVVDDTVHTMYRLDRRRGELEELPYGMIATTLLLSAGFAPFLASSFVPVRILGGMMAVVLLVAVLADLTLVPWVYRRATPRALAP